MFLLSRWSGGLVEHYGAKIPLVIGPITAAVGFALFAVPGVNASYWTKFLPAVVVLGLGMAISVAPLTTTVMNAVSESRVGIGSGINNAVSRAASLLAIAVLGIVMFDAFSRSLDRTLAELTLPGAVRHSLEDQRIKLAAIVIPEEIPPPQRRLVQQAIAESFVTGFRGVMLIGSGLALASALTAWALIGREPKHG
jgi:hypothetical protein